MRMVLASFADRVGEALDRLLVRSGGAMRLEPRPHAPGGLEFDVSPF
jgi:hypothetical protein